MSKEALKESIKHWEENLAFARNGEYGKIETSSEFCALCQEYPGMDCVGCPVEENTGLSLCEGTPWRFADTLTTKIKDLLDEYPIGHMFTDEKEDLIQAIEVELQYLKNLLIKISTTKS